MAEIPDYRLNFGMKHESQSNATITKDEMILKHYIRKEHDISFPMASCGFLSLALYGHLHSKTFLLQQSQ